WCIFQNYRGDGSRRRRPDRMRPVAQFRCPFPCRISKFACRPGLHWAPKVLTTWQILMERGLISDAETNFSLPSGRGPSRILGSFRRQDGSFGLGALPADTDQERHRGGADAQEAGEKEGFQIAAERDPQHAAEIGGKR